MAKTDKVRCVGEKRKITPLHKRQEKLTTEDVEQLMGMREKRRDGKNRRVLK